MIKDTITKQEGGDNSTNLQGQSIVINQGISYQDAKEIALDVFKANYLKLSENAMEIAEARVSELVDKFIAKIQQEYPYRINAVEQPGMQYAIYTAQKEYARTGDKDLLDLLVDILVDRAGENERSLKQIVLDECLKVIPTLTECQLDTLTVVFLLKYTINDDVHDIAGFKNYLQVNFAPFIDKISEENALYQHIEYTGCGNMSLAGIEIENIFLENYGVLFYRGFTKHEFEATGKKMEDYSTLICRCLHNESKFQPRIASDMFAKKNVGYDEQYGRNVAIMKELNDYTKIYQMNASEIRQVVLWNAPFMSKLMDVWNKTMQYMTLTSVGLTIASINLKRKSGVDTHLELWIK